MWHACALDITFYGCKSRYSTKYNILNAKINKNGISKLKSVIKCYIKHKTLGIFIFNIQYIDLHLHTRRHRNYYS